MIGPLFFFRDFQKYDFLAGNLVKFPRARNIPGSLISTLKIFIKKILCRKVQKKNYKKILAEKILDQLRIKIVKRKKF